MKRVFLKVTYRHGRPIAAYLHLPRLPGDVAAQTDRIDDVMLVDRAADGRPIAGRTGDAEVFQLQQAPGAVCSVLHVGSGARASLGACTCAPK